MLRKSLGRPPDSCHRGVSLRPEAEQLGDAVGGRGERVDGDMLATGDTDGDLLEWPQGLDDLLDAQSGAVL